MIYDLQGSFANKLKCGEVGQALEWANGFFEDLCFLSSLLWILRDSGGNHGRSLHPCYS